METIQAIQIIAILQTNSFPLKVLGSDAEIYYAKTIFQYSPPYQDVINEILGNRIYNEWGIKVPEMCIITIPNQLLQSFTKKNNIKSKYENFDTDRLFFIGFKEVQNQTELDCHNLNISKTEVKKYANITDFINISFCDLWLGNKDRRIKNPNILIAQEAQGFNFYAIDHTQLFAYQSSYKSLNIHGLDFERNNMLIASDLFKKICKFTDQRIIKKYSSTILDCINNTVEKLDDIFNDFPNEVGFSKKGKSKVKEVLSNEDRNKRIADNFKDFMQ